MGHWTLCSAPCPATGLPATPPPPPPPPHAVPWGTCCSKALLRQQSLHPPSGCPVGLCTANQPPQKPFSTPGLSQTHTSHSSAQLPNNRTRKKSFADRSHRHSSCSSQAVKHSYTAFKQFLYFSLESAEFQSWEKDDSCIKFPYSGKLIKEASR